MAGTEPRAVKTTRFQFYGPCVFLPRTGPEGLGSFPGSYRVSERHLVSLPGNPAARGPLACFSFGATPIAASFVRPEKYPMLLLKIGNRTKVVNGVAYPLTRSLLRA